MWPGTMFRHRLDKMRRVSEGGRGVRADRLIALLMLLESRGPLTAKDLARELEVSERTVYRDMEALSMAGIPVYGRPGPEGGFQLMEGYRSYLDRLNKDEIMALLTLHVPEPFQQMEVGSKLKSAMLKIRSMYTHLSAGEERMAERVFMDSTNWNSAKDAGDAGSHLNQLYRAIDQRRQVAIRYSHPTYPTYPIQMVAEPYGLVVKERKWYLVYAMQGKIRVLDTAHIIQFEETGNTFVVSEGFDLQDFWEKWVDEVDEQYASFRVVVLVPRKLAKVIPDYIKKGKVPFGPTISSWSKEEWTAVEMYFESLEEARSKLLSFGSVVKVVEPMALRYSLLDYAEEIIRLYRE